MKIDEDELAFYMEEVARDTGLPKGSFNRKLFRFSEGRRLYAGTAEDWEQTDFDFTTEAQGEADDEWVYLVTKLWLTRMDGDTTWKRLVSQVLILKAVAEHLLAEAKVAQTAEQSADEKEGAGSVTTADGGPVTPSTMECFANDSAKDDPAQVGYRIMLERKRCGFTEAELAEKAGPLSASRIYALESGEYSGLSDWEIEYIAKALGVTKEYLLTGEPGD